MPLIPEAVIAMLACARIRAVHSVVFGGLQTAINAFLSLRTQKIPTAIRVFMKWGEEYPQKHQLKSLRLLGSVGEPINLEAWMWYGNLE